MADSNSTVVEIFKETTYGTTPTGLLSGDVMRFTSFNFTAQPTTVTSTELSTTRQVSDQLLTTFSMQGEMGIELSATTYDKLMQGVMNDGTWPLTIGNDPTQNQFTIMAAYSVNGTLNYYVYKGCRVGGMTLNFPYGGVVTGSFKFMGKEAVASNTVRATALGAGTSNPATVTGVMIGSKNGTLGVTALTIAGGAPGTTVKAITLNVENNLRPVEGMLSIGPSGLTHGRCMVTGSVEMYFDSVAHYNNMLNNAATSMEWTVGDGTKTYTFTLTNMKWTDGAPAVTGVDTDVMVTLNYIGLYHSTDSALKIAKT